MDLQTAIGARMEEREAEDRLVALEALTIGLIRALRGAGVLREAQVDALLDRVEDLMTGHPGATFAAQQLVAAVDAQGFEPGDESMPEAHLRESFRRILYERDEAFGIAGAGPARNTARNHQEISRR